MRLMEPVTSPVSLTPGQLRCVIRRLPPRVPMSDRRMHRLKSILENLAFSAKQVGSMN